MADSKISALTALAEGSWATDDEIPIVDTDAGATKRTTIADFDTRFIQAAADVAITDTGGLYTATDVEGALAEVKTIADAAAPATILPPVEVAGTTDTLASTDSGKINIYTSDSAVTVTLPTDAADDLADGFECTLYAEGTGGVSIDTTGLTILGDGTHETAIAQGESLFVKKTATADTWIVLGGTFDINDILTALLNVDGTGSGLDADLLDGNEAAAFTLNTAVDVSTNSWVIDEDTMVSDLDTKVPTQQSVKAYVDANSGGTVDTSGTPVATDFARFTDANTIEGRSPTEVLSDLSLDADLATFAVPASTTISTYGATLVDDADAATARTTLGLVIGTNVQAFDADTLKADTADTLTAGFDSSDFAAGTKSSGTYTPAASDGNFQVATNGGAHTLAPPTTSCSIVIHYTNNGSAGAITTSGFTQVTGDDFTTTDTHEFVCVITKINDVSVLNVTALQ